MKQPREKYDALSMFVPELGKIVIAGKGGVANFDNLIQQSGMAQYIAMASDVGYPETLVRTNYRNLAPRFGLAWRPFGDARTVIRSGYGIFYGTDSLNRYNAMSQTYPFIVTQSYSASTSNPLLLTLSNATASTMKPASRAIPTTCAAWQRRFFRSAWALSSWINRGVPIIPPGSSPLGSSIPRPA